VIQKSASPQIALQPIDPGQRQQPLQDRRQADQHHKQFEKVCQARLVDELVDGSETDGAHDANDQNPDQN
jgi:hypothetical protein